MGNDEYEAQKEANRMLGKPKEHEPQPEYEPQFFTTTNETIAAGLMIRGFRCAKTEKIGSQPRWGKAPSEIWSYSFSNAKEAAKMAQQIESHKAKPIDPDPRRMDAALKQAREELARRRLEAHYDNLRE